MKRILFIIILGIWVGSVAGQTGQLTIVWDQNTEPDIASYRVERSVNNGVGSLQNVAHPATVGTTMLRFRKQLSLSGDHER
ncbi:MAG: hypothetical protein R3C26_07200 [Calditrichia bacterium]